MVPSVALPGDRSSVQRLAALVRSPERTQRYTRLQTIIYKISGEKMGKVVLKKSGQRRDILIKISVKSSRDYGLRAQQQHRSKSTHELTSGHALHQLVSAS